jgi:hypothetical protein
MADFYDFGQTVTITAEFADAEGVDVDPGTLTLKVRSPGGVETEYDYADDEITRTADVVAGTIIYSVDVTPDEDGRWYAVWDGVTDGNHTVVEYYFYVKPTVFTS